MGETEAVSSSEGHWNLRLFGEFCLTDPKGAPARLKTKKAEGVLAILLLNHGSPVKRSLLQENFWPNLDAGHRQNNLRQALSHIKAVLGQDAIAAGRDCCSINASFLIRSEDAELVRAHLEEAGSMRLPKETLLPEQDGPWFDGLRARLRTTSRTEFATVSDTDSAIAELPPPVQPFIELLKWHISTDAPRALELTRTHYDLCSSVGPRLLLELMDGALERTSHGHPCYGWGLFWKGVSLTQISSLEAAAEYFKRVDSCSALHSDMRLRAESMLWQGVIESLTGNASIALRRARAARSEAESSGDEFLKTRMLHLEGAALAHLGLLEEGAELIGRSVDSKGMEPYPHEAAISTSIQALHLAIAGKSEEAIPKLEEAERYLGKLDSFRLRLITKLARAIILLNDHEDDSALKILDEIMADKMGSQEHHIAVYSRETRAVASMRKREKGAAIDELKESEAIRRRLNMNYTHWDSARLQEIAEKRKK